ncbi:MAG: polyribonucleotide nucleotidyltransferase [Gemmatimonadota bacterium]|nr:polyribonucleotide nucleotidyltransferase [Gemmatimonadota bacterium]
MTTQKRIQVGGREMVIETGKMARLAGGSVTVRYGDTLVLCTATASAEPDYSRGWFPLFVEYREKMYSAGKIPGGFFKREGRPGEKETISARQIDRPMRPLFPDGYLHETQLVCQVFSYDGSNDPDVLGIVGCSAAAMISEIPFQGPVAGVRVARIDGEFVINPTNEQVDASELDLVVAGTAESVTMVEGWAGQAPEDVMLEAMKAGHEAIRTICGAIEELTDQVGKAEMAWSPPEKDEQLATRVADWAREDMRGALKIADKEERNLAMDAVRGRTLEHFEEELGDAFDERTVKDAVEKLKKREMRAMVLEQGVRADGRSPEEIRPVDVEVGVLPRTHGSALFTRGNTQSLGTVTLGTKQDQQMIDDLDPKWDKTFMLHYNFPPYSVGEVGFFRGPGRREIGHGALAERSLKSVLPSHEDFSYTIRIVSDILESNGSSSMATVCSGSLSMMDAGVPIEKPVAGIAMGLIKEGDDVAILSDIMGIEDFLGDMDFKVAGTESGITGFQLDTKTQGISFEILERALEQAREGRLHILGVMNRTISEPRESLSRWAPRIITIRIPKKKIGDVIGSGGKVIRGLQEETGAEINVDEVDGEGIVTISALEGEGGEEARRRIEEICEEPEVGKVYEGPVKNITHFGAFVEFLPGQDGLVHISELEHHRVDKVEDVCSEGDTMRVKLIGIDDRGRVKLSRRALIPKDGDQQDGGGR